MLTNNFSFDLPPELIAQEPAPDRDASRLMVLPAAPAAPMEHHSVRDLPELLPQDSVLVFNDSRVRKARLYGRDSATGRERELLFVDPVDPWRWKVLTPNAARIRPDHRLELPGGLEAHFGAPGDCEPPYRLLHCANAIDDAYLEEHGHIPLPPYIHRADTGNDQTRYQTVYARELGSVAAPTAGLHFTPDLIRRIRDRGIETHFVTLHVGIGTFLPVRTAVVEDHRMHAERYEIRAATAEAIERARRAGRKVVAVGTTALRTLEAAGATGVIRGGQGETALFIYPGYRFRVVDGLFTNFHTSESTLFMLVSAFVGLERIRNAYQEAIARRYRFFSYGDATLLWRSQ